MYRNAFLQILKLVKTNSDFLSDCFTENKYLQLNHQFKVYESLYYR